MSEKLDFYTIRLLAWYFGLSFEEVKKEEWSQEEIDRAQKYCIKKHADF